MVNVIALNRDTSFKDNLFSFYIRMIQKLVINGVGVKFRLRKKKVQGRMNFASETGFDNTIRDLGLVPERLWWGPMTLSPVKVEVLLSEIDKNPPTKVLEVGGGTSSAVFAAAAEKYGFDVLSLENYYPTVEYVKFLLKGLACSERLTIQICDLVSYRYSNGDKYRWYKADLGSIQDPIDFVLIDGPMSSLVGRNGALPQIIPYLAEGHRIFLDDATRDHERACIEEWKKHYPELTVDKPSDKCNLARIRIPNIRSIQSRL